MSGERGAYDWLRDGIALVLRVGTYVAIGIVGIGYAVGLLAGSGEGQRPLVDLIGAGGAPAIIGAGLLGLTLLPVAVLAAAGIGFARGGERGRLLTTLAVIGLLLVSLLAAAILARPG